MAGKRESQEPLRGYHSDIIMLSQPGELSVLVFTLKNSMGALPLYVHGSLGHSGEVSSEGSLMMSWAKDVPHSSLDCWWTLVREHLA